MIFILLIFISATLYFFFLLFVTQGLFHSFPQTITRTPFVSVLIPVRNEEERVGACIDSVMNQTYPAEKIEVIVIDDASNDSTSEIVLEKIKLYPNLHLIYQSQNERGFAPKKNAIEKGVAKASGEIIFALDGDCIASRFWIQTMIPYFTPDTGAVLGWVGLSCTRDFFCKIQHLEYLAFIGIARGFAGMGVPTMANANNLAYRASVFKQVNGFTGINHIASGDDELLVQKIADTTSWKIAFCDEAKAINLTAPSKSVGQFLNQRIRWASKGTFYKRKWLKLLLGALFSYYCLFIFFIFAAIFQFHFIKYAAILLFIKCMIDLPLTLFTVIKTKNTRFLFYYVFAEIFQLFYIPLVSLAGIFGWFTWKKHLR
jgi:cellulose synthase/poly-beta-1,6-N-acetylglucosamine synthase-like glycosyltransferase